MNKFTLSEIRQRMSGAGSIIRDREKISCAASEAYLLLKNIKHKAGASSTKELAECFRISDNCLTHLLYLEAIRAYIEKKGRSRGSYIVTSNKESGVPDISVAELDIFLCRYDREVERDILEVCFRKDKIVINVVKVREIPLQNLWFERIWKDYIEDNYIES